jgi:Ca2+-binding EF-hand superfamily protein
VIDVFNSCPARFRGDTLNSDNIKNSIENITDLRHIARDKTEKIFRYVHMRLEEKFKDYRRAFRGFDTNYDGTLSFKEFMNGLENLGIRLDIKEFRSIY